MSADSTVCLATVTTDSFVTGTLVMLHSFLAHNRWFKGDIVVIHGGLDALHREFLAQVHDRVQFLEVTPQLQERVNEVTRVFPEAARIQARFYSLEAFRLRGYDKVLFCDSDLLFRRTVEELFALPQPLVACGDRPYYSDSGRQWRVRRDDSESGEEVAWFRNTFNSGFVLIGRELLTDEHYEGLLNLVDGDLDDECPMLADQIVLNLHFAGRQHLVSATYNYALTHWEGIYRKEGIGLTDACVVHFCGPAKPWRPNQILHASQEDPVFIKAAGFWFEDYVACLQRLYLHGRVVRGLAV